MGRKNNRIVEDTYLPTIKEGRRPSPRCYKFPTKTVFITGYGAQVAIDEIRAVSKEDVVPVRVYECKAKHGGCGFFHITSQEYEE